MTDVELPSYHILTLMLPEELVKHGYALESRIRECPETMELHEICSLMEHLLNLHAKLLNYPEHSGCCTCANQISNHMIWLHNHLNTCNLELNLRAIRMGRWAVFIGIMLLSLGSSLSIYGLFLQNSY